MKKPTCRKDSIDNVNEIMNETYIVPATQGNATLLDLLICIKDTTDVETLVELKTFINGILDNEICFKLHYAINVHY